MKQPVSDVDVATLLSPLDLVVFGLILLLTLLSVLFGQWRKKKSVVGKDPETSMLDLLVMGRMLTLPMFIATLVATWYGGIFGVTQYAFEYGIYNFITQGAFWYVAYIIFALFIIDRISVYKAVTLPDLIRQMFGPYSGKLSALFCFFNILPIAYATGIGLFLQLIFGGELWLMMSIGVGVVILYSAWGGLRAVVFSDLVQFFVMCAAVLFILLFSIHHFGGWSYLKTELPANHFSPTGGHSLATTLVWGFIALATLVDPNFYQRCFAAKSPRTAKKGILISTGIWFGFDICTTLGGMYARAAIPEASSEHAYLIYAVQILPDGFRGFVLAGIAATILSTLDSYLFIAGTTLSYDLMPKRLKGRVMLHHIGIVIVGILSVVIATRFEGHIVSIWKTLGSYFASCLLLPVMLGYLFPGRIRDWQFVCGCLFGVVGTTIWRNMELTGFAANIDALYVGALSTCVGLLAFPVLRRSTVVK